MTAENYFKKHYPVTMEGLQQPGITIQLAESYAKYKLEQQSLPEKEYKMSARANKIAQLIQDQFMIKLKPGIFRRYTDCDVVKFEMKSYQDESFLFEGTVVEFLKPEADIYCIVDGFSNRFTIMNKEPNYKIQ